MKIEIVVRGQVASGKTVIAQAISQFLKEKGFTQVTLSDVDTDPHAEPNLPLLERKMAAIVTVQTPRERTPR